MCFRDCTGGAVRSLIPSQSFVKTQTRGADGRSLLSNAIRSSIHGSGSKRGGNAASSRRVPERRHTTAAYTIILLANVHRATIRVQDFLQESLLRRKLASGHGGTPFPKNVLFVGAIGRGAAHTLSVELSDVFLMTIPVEPSDLTRFSRMQAAGFSQEGISRLKRLAALCRRATSMPVSKRMDIRVHRRPCTLSVHQFAMDILTRIHQSLPAIGFQPGVIHLMERLACYFAVLMSNENTQRSVVSTSAITPDIIRLLTPLVLCHRIRYSKDEDPSVKNFSVVNPEHVISETATAQTTFNPHIIPFHAPSDCFSRGGPKRYFSFRKNRRQIHTDCLFIVPPLS